LELQNSGDLEYLALLNAGFESPKMVTNIIDGYETNVMGPKKVEYLWHPTDNDEKLWTDVEFHKYGNNVLERHQFNTKAHFKMDKNGDTIVHAPNDSGLRIIKKTPSINTFSFLGIGDDSSLF